MDELFSEPAREVVAVAAAQARADGSRHVGSEHLLLGLLSVQDGPARRALEPFAFDVVAVRTRMRRVYEPGGQRSASERLWFNSHAKDVLATALRDARTGTGGQIDTGHMLRALLRYREGDAVHALLGFDAASQRFAADILRLTAASPSAEADVDIAADPGTTALHKLLTDANTVAPLTAQEEIKLAKRIECGDREARRQLVAANLRLIAPVAERYRQVGLSLNMLIAGGLRGLHRAAESFDYRAGFAFATYADTWVRQGITRALADARY